MKLEKEEYDNLKYIEHEYNYMIKELCNLIKNADDIQSGELKLDNEEMARILKRYIDYEYELRKEEIKNER